MVAYLTWSNHYSKTFRDLFSLFCSLIVYVLLLLSYLDLTQDFYLICVLFSSLFVPLHPDPISTQKSLLSCVLCLFRFCVSSTDLCSLGFILLLIVYFLLLYLYSLQLKSLLTGVFCTRHLQLHLQVISVGFWNPFRQCSIMVVSVLLEKVSYKVNDVHIVVASLTKHFWTTIHVQQLPFTYSI